MNLLLAQAAGANEAVPFLPPWAQIVIASFGLVGTLGTAWIGYLVVKANRKQAETAESVKEVERKVTSNHGHGNLGDKTDEIFEVVLEVKKLIPKLVNGFIENRNRINDLREDVEALKQGQIAHSGVIADNTVSTVVSFKELEEKMDEAARAVNKQQQQ